MRSEVPDGDGWAYEPKWDGFRAVAWSGDIRLDSRNHKPLLRYFPELAPSLGVITGDVVPGWMVCLVEPSERDCGC